ncbi:MAG: hypothetical protein H0U74_08835 [Bradymonadaceae bacterium]|nr:hypothetical protein [Lujinxingiaceae bacterium]
MISSRCKLPLYLVLVVVFAIAGCSSDPDDSKSPKPDDALTIEILAGPALLTAQTSAQFELGCNRDAGCTFECALDDAEPAPCTSPASYDLLEDGEHRFGAVAIDSNGERSEPASWSWTVDSNLPAVTELDGPLDPTSSTDAIFSFACSKADCTFACSLNGEARAACQSGIGFEDLGDGAHVFSVWATDALGTTGTEMQWIWTVDTAAPSIVDLEGPDELTNATSASFSFACSKADCTFFCALNEAEYVACESGVSFDELSDGEQLFEVYAIDALGNDGSEASFSWQVDTEVPVIAFTATPDQTTLETTANFAFECTNKPDCSFECSHSYDDGQAGAISTDWESCAGVDALDELPVGDYTLAVRANDAAGNQGLGDYAWTVEPNRLNQTALGFAHTCAIRADGTLWCWGLNNNGQLGQDDTIKQSSPVQVGDQSDWSSVTAGNAHVCALRSGELWCWGFNGDGELGHGDTVNRRLPVRVGTESDWSTVAAGEYFTCGVRSGELWCWGYNEFGPLGQNDTTQQNLPVRVGQESDWSTVTAGSEHACGLRNGELWCWGRNDFGQLGLDHDIQQGTPGRVGTENDWSVAFIGASHSCAIRKGELWCWGINNFGQLGLNNNADQWTPVRVGTANSWGLVSGGFFHTCGLQNGELWCWGDNGFGRLGLDDETSHDVPARVGTANDWNWASLGNFHTCANRGDELWCWGRNHYGQLGLGDDTDTDHNTPMQVW